MITRSRRRPPNRQAILLSSTVLVLVLPAVFALLACTAAADTESQRGAAASAPGGAAAGAVGAAGSRRASSSQDDPGQALATIDGETVTLADIEAQVGDELAAMDYQYRSQRHEVVETSVQELIADRLLGDEAAARGITVEELLRLEVDSQVRVTDEEISGWYDANRDRLGGRSLAQIEPQIRDMLVQYERSQVVAGLVDRLAEGRDVVVLLEPFRAEFDLAGAPSKGRDDAPVTLVEFSDFQCPYCARFRETVDRLADAYAREVRVVFLQFPLEQLHPDAFGAAEAALCADEQGRFWELHDVMFDEQDRLGTADLEEKATRLGLDAAAFSACLDSGKYAERIRAELRAGARVGVTGTPAAFINGRQVPGGAATYEQVEELLLDELRRRTSGS